MADVEVGTRRIETLLHAQRLTALSTALELLDEMVFRDDLQRVAADLVHLFIDGRKLLGHEGS